MRTLASLALIATTLCAPAPARAQDASLEELKQRIATLEAELARLSIEVEALEAAREAPPPPATSVTPVVTAEAAPPFSIKWKGAPEIEAPGGWSFKPRGRLQFDAGLVDAPASTNADDGFDSELRRARLGVEGTMPGGFAYKFEGDFTNNEVELADAIVTYTGGPLRITAGQHNNFQSLDELTSSLHTSFIERAAFTDAFGFERRLGLSFQYSRGIAIVQAGMFTDNAASLPGDAWGLHTRLVLTPMLADTQAHLAGSLHHNDLGDTTTKRYRQRPFVHFTSVRFLDTGSFSARSESGAGLEAALIRGPFHAAGEAFWQHVDRPGALADPTFFGGYAELGLFLTPGDKRGYRGGIFDRTRPKRPVGDGGIGAIALNLRYDYLDLVDAGIIGGIQNGYLASLIWTLTDYTRLMLNYGRLDHDRAVLPAAGGDRSYTVDSLGMRAQVDF